jgi:hypothetical protein
MQGGVTAASLHQASVIIKVTTHTSILNKESSETEK